ncbi:MAG TPA: FAD-binding oxidoreductase, partial [Myxococcales bacterium]|nr:FAD-binding oxidoreductase [Myxococcales bacterium]
VKYQRGRVTWRKDHASDLWSVRIAPESRIEFEPGQYVTLGLTDPATGKMIERAYSVCSAPHEEELEFFFELVPQGKLTPKLFELKPGADVWMRRRAKGAFTIDRRGGRRNHFMAATVTGIAPALSMVRSLRREKPDLRLVIVQAGSRSHELGYREELERAAAESGGWLTYVPTVSRPWEDPEWKGERGRAEDVLRKHLDLGGFTPEDSTARRSTSRSTGCPRRPTLLRRPEPRGNARPRAPCRSTCALAPRRVRGERLSQELASRSLLRAQRGAGAGLHHQGGGGLAKEDVEECVDSGHGGRPDGSATSGAA